MNLLSTLPPTLAFLGGVDPWIFTFAFFTEYFDEGTANARSHAPVDGADVIATLIGAMLFEVDTTPSDLRDVRARHAKAGA